MQPWHEPFAGKGYASADGQVRGIHIVRRTDKLGLPSQIAQETGDGDMELRSFVCEDNPTGKALEQRDSKMPFQRLDVSAHCSVCDMQFRSSERHAQKAPRRFESAQGLQRRKTAKHAEP